MSKKAENQSQKVGSICYKKQPGVGKEITRFHLHYELSGHSQRMIIEGEPLDVALTIVEALHSGARNIRIWQ